MCQVTTMCWQTISLETDSQNFCQRNQMLIMYLLLSLPPSYSGYFIPKWNGPLQLGWSCSILLCTRHSKNYPRHISICTAQVFRILLYICNYFTISSLGRYIMLFRILLSITQSDTPNYQNIFVWHSAHADNIGPTRDTSFHIIGSPTSSAVRDPENPCTKSKKNQATHYTSSASPDTAAMGTPGH